MKTSVSVWGGKTGSGVWLNPAENEQTFAEGNGSHAGCPRTRERSWQYVSLWGHDILWMFCHNKRNLMNFRCWGWGWDAFIFRLFRVSMRRQKAFRSCLKAISHYGNVFSKSVLGIRCCIFQLSSTGDSSADFYHLAASRYDTFLIHLKYCTPFPKI